MLAYMRDHITMSLATACDGEPRAATLFYANDGFDLFFLSSPDSLHSCQVLTNPRVFVTISQDYADWRGIQGIQLRGRAALLEDDARGRAIYLAKFPFVAGFPDTGFRYWQITAEWVRMIDNTLGFAHKDEIELGM